MSAKKKETYHNSISSFMGDIYENASKVISNYVLEKEMRSDQEFLPAAISIIETPPSPIHIAIIRAICALAVATILWMHFGHIDILAVAQGKIQPSGRVKTIQSIEHGRIRSINVRNGQHVTVGETLVELDPAEAISDERSSSINYFAYHAETLRRKTALDYISHYSNEEIPGIEWPDFVPQKIRDRETRVLKGDLEQTKSIIQSYDAQIKQKELEQRRIENQIVSEVTLLNTLKQRVNMRKAIFSRGSTSKAAVIDALETMQTQETVLAGQKGQLEEAKASIIVLKKDRKKAIDTFIADNQQKLSEAERQADELEQKAVKAGAKMDRMSLKSPISGTVLGLSVTTKNQVIQSGDEIMRIVPDDTSLEIEAYVENKDIGFIKVGQPAVIKIESFPFTRYGSIDGIVTHVSHDAIPQPDATSTEGMPTKSKKESFLGGAQRTQNLVFQVLLNTKQDFMNVEGIKIPFSSGMAVTAEIKTGKRRIIEYIFSPLVEVSSRAIRER